MASNVQQTHAFVSHRVFEHIDEYISAMPGWDTEIAQLESGRFESRRLLISTQTCRYIFLRHNLRTMVKAYNPGPDMQFFIPLPNQALPHFIKYREERPVISYIPAGTGIDAITPPKFEGVSLSLRLDRYHQWMVERYTPQKGYPPHTQTSTFQATTEQMSELQRLLRDIEDKFHPTKAVDQPLATWLEQKTEREIAPILLQIIVYNHDRVVSTRPDRLQSAVRILLQNIDSPPSIRELAAQLDTSERNLQYLFKSHLGISPKQFIRLYRLNVARQRLWDSPYKRGLIADIANQLGYWHMGYFAQDFKRLFNVNPSDVLAIDHPNSVRED